MILPNFNIYMDFSRHHFYCFKIVPLFVLEKSMAQNRCLQHPCFKSCVKLLKPPKIQVPTPNAQHFLSDLLTHSRFHSMLFALPGYQFPYIVMNRCLYLTYKSTNNLKLPMWLLEYSLDNLVLLRFFAMIEVDYTCDLVWPTLLHDRSCNRWVATKEGGTGGPDATRDCNFSCNHQVTNLLLHNMSPK